MSLTSKLVALALIVLAIVTGVWKIWHTADKAGYERSQREYQEAAERQRESNRGTARKAEGNEAVRVVYRDRIITQTTTEVRDASAPLASCPLPLDTIRLLNNAAKCAREGGSASCSADDALPNPG